MSVPATESYGHEGGPVAALLIHGFTGSPKALRPWADHLAANDITVRVPLLPGHGTTWKDLNRVQWDDWYETVAGELAALREKHQSVFVCGFSMGGALALRLAEQQPSSVAGLVLVNPIVHTERLDRFLLPFARHLIPSFPGIINDINKPGEDEGGYERLPLQGSYSMTQLWAVVKRDITTVRAPLLLLHSAQDHVVEPSNSEWVFAHVSSAEKTKHVLPNSFHIAPLDYDAPTIFTESLEFIRRYSNE